MSQCNEEEQQHNKPNCVFLTMRYVAILLALLPGISFAALQKTTLKAAMDKGLVQLAASSTAASYHGKGLRLHVTNLTKDVLQIKIDPALIFRPADTTYQDYLLPAEELLAVAPGASTTMDVQTFCAKSTASAPIGNLHFTFLRQGDSMLIKTAQYLRRNNLLDGLGQSAIWALTNYKELRGVYDEERHEVSKKLCAYMAAITGWAMPEYFVEKKPNLEPGKPVVAPHITRVFAEMSWKLDTAKVFSLGIYNAAGRLVKGVLPEKLNPRGTYKLTVKFESEAEKPGIYFIRLMSSGAVLNEKKVIVE